MGKLFFPLLSISILWGETYRDAEAIIYMYIVIISAGALGAAHGINHLSPRYRVQYSQN